MDGLEILYVVCVIGGIAYGAFNSLCPTLISEIFGLDNFAAIYGTNSLALGIGSYVIGTKLAGGVYDAHAIPPAHKVCYKETCFQDAYIVCAALCTTAALVSFYLARRTKPRYAETYPRYFSKYQ